MKITQVRNATMILSYKEHNILIDPMLAGQGKLPRLCYLGGGSPNPLVELPEKFDEISNKVDFALITHCQKGHFDHLDRRGASFLRQRKIPVFSNAKDQTYLNKLGLLTTPLKRYMKNNFFDGTIELVNARHGIGGISFLMEHGVGYFIRLPQMPSLYIMGDTVLTDEIRSFIDAEQPDYIVAPTGMAKFDIGSPILLTEKETIELSKLSRGKIIANHMDALDHCRVSRSRLKGLMAEYSLRNILVPEDGESIDLGF